MNRDQWCTVRSGILCALRDLRKLEASFVLSVLLPQEKGGSELVEVHLPDGPAGLLDHMDRVREKWNGGG